MATTGIQGKHTRHAIATESTYGTAPNGSAGGVYDAVGVYSSTVGATRELAYEALLDGRREANDPYLQAETVGGDIEIPIEQHEVGLWLAQAIGAPTTTDVGGGDYQHVFESGSFGATSFALELGNANSATALYEMFTGLKIASITGNYATGERPGFTLSCTGQARAESASPEDATPTEATRVLFQRPRRILTLQDDTEIAVVHGAEMTIDNGLFTNLASRSDDRISGLDLGEQLLTGSLQARFEGNTNLRSPVAAQTPLKLQLIRELEGSAHKLTLEIPRVFLDVAKGERSGPDGVVIEHEWRASYDTTAGYMFRFVLVNGTASY